MQTSTQTKRFIDLFERESVPTLPVETERAAIIASQKGDQKATMMLLSAYMPAIKTAIRDWARADTSKRSSNELFDDARMAAIEGALLAIRDFDVTQPVEMRLATRLPYAVKAAVNSVTAETMTVYVPERTLSRYFGIMRKHEGNVYAAAAHATEYEMSAETFLAVHEAVSKVDSLSADFEFEDSSSYSGSTRSGRNSGSIADQTEDQFAGVPKWDSGISDAEDRILVEAALSVLTPQEKEIIRMGYGFEERPLPDAEIATLLVLSRQKVQRLRTAALTKMRDRLGAL